MEILYSEGVDVDATDAAGRTALIRALAPDIASIVNPDFKPGPEVKSITEVIQWLSDRGANLKHADNSGYAAIHHAVRNGIGDAVEDLVTRDPSLLNSEVSTWQPLHLAVAFNRYEIAKFLILSGAVTQVKISDKGQEFSLLDLVNHIYSSRDREKMTTLINSQQSSFALRDNDRDSLVRSSDNAANKDREMGR
jgi:ankyrin repeat protein